jgi:hypothetical protein
VVPVKWTSLRVTYTLSYDDVVSLASTTKLG